MIVLFKKDYGEIPKGTRFNLHATESFIDCLLSLGIVTMLTPPLEGHEMKVCETEGEAAEQFEHEYYLEPCIKGKGVQLHD